MRAIRTTALLVLTTAGSAQAAPQTVVALQNANVPLSASQLRTINTSNGDALALALGKLAKSSPTDAVAIISAVIPVHPELASPFVSALVTAVPEQLGEILEAAIAAAPDQAAELATLVSDLAPTAAGESAPSFSDNAGTGVPSTGNAGTGSTPRTASPS